LSIFRKRRLSSRGWLRWCCNGEKVVIAKNNLPLVDLVPHKKEGKRVLGHLAGKIELPEVIDG
jgi:antitoxin (DNA-binding transcriptional repressor) of toxin-antitoxin stability system